MLRKLIERMTGVPGQPAAPSCRATGQLLRFAPAVQPFEGRLVPATLSLQTFAAATGPAVVADAGETQSPDGDSVLKDKPKPPPPPRPDYLRITLTDVLISG